jgi:hypothetical protein
MRQRRRRNEEEADHGQGHPDREDAPDGLDGLGLPTKVFRMGLPEHLGALLLGDELSRLAHGFPHSRRWIENAT